MLISRYVAVVVWYVWNIVELNEGITVAREDAQLRVCLVLICTVLAKRMEPVYVK